MISKETLIAWLYEHGKLTADLEFDIHDCFDAALDAAQTALQSMPGIGRMSTKKRLASFYSVCENLDRSMTRGELDPSAAMVALFVMRMLSPDFRKAITEFDHHAPRADDEELAALPPLARAYMDLSGEFNAPLIAG